MNEKEKQLTAVFLKLASSEFSNHGCNDVDEKFWKDWTLEERQRLVKEYHDYNGDPEEYSPKHLHLPDYALMSFLAFKITQKETIEVSGAFRFYKELDGGWYVDLPEWPGSKSDLKMVAGADTMLEYMAEGNNEVKLYLSEKELQGCDCLRLEGKATDIGNGAYYFMEKYRGIDINLKIWLCDVTLYVFDGRFPESIFVSVTN